MVAAPHTQLLSHWNSWNEMSGAPQVVTYSFAKDGPAGWAGFSATQQASARKALAAWDAVSGLAFVEVPDVAGGAGIDIRFRFENLGGPVNLGKATLPEQGGDVALNVETFRTDSLAPHATRIGHQVLLHEIGHALGLAHPDADTPDAQANTLMVATIGRGSAVNAPLAWDIAAIQALYGTPAAEAALGITWRWDGAVRGDGTARGDTMNGTAHRDALYGGAGNDVLNGFGGDDRLVPGAGDDVIAGGAGRDTLVLATHRAALRLDPAGAVESAEGRDRFSGIEAIDLLDGTLHLAPAPELAALAGLYQVALGRAPDAGGLAFWWQDFQAAPDLARIAARFQASAEYQLAPSGLTPAELAARATAAAPTNIWLPDAEALLVARLYELALGRAPDVDGFAFWTGHLQAGIAAEVIAAEVLRSPEASARPQPWDSADALLAAARAEMWSRDVVFI